VKTLKTLGVGVVNFLARFIVGGILFMGVGMNAEGFAFGVLLTLAAAIVAYVLLKYVMKPASTGEAVKIALVWVVIAAVLDLATAQPVVGVAPSFLATQIQFWTRLLAIVAVAPFTFRPQQPSIA
jgi:hypothetical protein